jgi:hypothetical protein
MLHDGILVGQGYAGAGAGKDNPAEQAIHETGPVPQGGYTIGPARNLPHFGSLVMELTPDTANEMFGRSGFLIHGDSLAHPGHGSEGCIVLPEAARQAIADSQDRLLLVVSGEAA